MTQRQARAALVLLAVIAALLIFSVTAVTVEVLR